MCKLHDDRKSIENCIDEKTFDKTEVIHGLLHSKVNINLKSVKGDFGGGVVGMYFTFHVNDTFDSSYINSVLAYNHTYEIFIHDSNFLALTFNPTFPFLPFSLSPFLPF